MGTHKKRGNGEGTIFKREINGKRALHVRRMAFIKATEVTP